MRQEDLLNKYYTGETSHQEENELKAIFTDDENDSTEKEMFGYFQNESYVPEDLEEFLYSGISEKQRKTKLLRIRLFSIGSVAASILIILSIFIFIQSEKNAQIENNFLVMEKALYQVSESIQPDELQEMMILWVDNDVEIIIN